MALSTMFSKSHFINKFKIIHVLYRIFPSGARHIKLAECRSQISTTAHRCNEHMQYNSRFTKFMKKDNIPEDFELIYRNPTTNILSYAQAFAILSGVVFVTLSLYFPFLENYSNETGEGEEDIFGPENPLALAASVAGLGLFCVTIQIIAMKSPVRIYSHGKRFILVKNTWIGGFKTISIEFNAGECKIAPPKKYSLFNHIRYEVKGKDYLIYDNQFRTSADYNSMMGSIARKPY